VSEPEQAPQPPAPPDARQLRVESQNVWLRRVVLAGTFVGVGVAIGAAVGDLLGLARRAAGGADDAGDESDEE
jgi:hypothetical protein